MEAPVFDITAVYVANIVDFDARNRVINSVLSCRARELPSRTEKWGLSRAVCIDVDAQR